MAERAPAWMLAILATLAVQVAAALSTGLFDQVGPGGTVWLRLSAGALIFLTLRRPRLRGRTRKELAFALVLGAVTGTMTVLALSAIALIPLGTAVAIEFLGPLTVAVIGTRSLWRLVWPILALGGVLLLTEPWSGGVDRLGIVYAAGAAVGWGTYILLTAQVGDKYDGLEGLSITIPIAALTTAAVGVPQAAGHVTLGVVAAAVGLALLAPILVFALELLALRRLTTSAFGTLMALEPAVGTGIGGLLLAQLPTLLQAAGIVLVVGAGIGAARGGQREPRPRSGPHPVSSQEGPRRPDVSEGLRTATC
jgi:inner membrane transporter RhtA